MIVTIRDQDLHMSDGVRGLGDLLSLPAVGLSLFHLCRYMAACGPRHPALALAL